MICLDDLDLIFGSRNGNYSPWVLGEFLSSMDGFLKNDVFVLASTNDPEFLDKAASRPRRFDMVIDFNKINGDNYLELIQSNCDTPEMLDVIDDSLISTLKKNKITDAYLVNLIKQLEIKYKLDPECDLRKYIRNLIKLTYRGFYKNSEEQQVSFGFNNTDNMEIEAVGF